MLNYMIQNSLNLIQKQIKLIKRIDKKAIEQYKNNEISEKEYNHKINDLDSIEITDEGMKYEYFLDNNKNKILEEHRVNDNLYRIETIEQN